MVLRATVPEVAVDKDRDATGWVYEIGRTSLGKLAMEPESGAGGVQGAP